MNSNADIDNFIRCINSYMTDNKNKRKHTDLTDSVTQDLNMTALDNLLCIEEEILNNKGRKLSKVIKDLQQVFEGLNAELKKESNITRDIPDIIKLGLIAELSVTMHILEKISKLCLDDRTKTFSDCIKSLKKELEPENKKTKYEGIIINFKNKDDTDTDNNSEYDEDYEYDSSDPGSSDESSDESDNDECANNKNDPINSSCKEFVNRIFKSKEEDIEGDIIKYFNELPKKDRINISNRIKEVNSYRTNSKPILFRIMELPLPVSQKHQIIKTYTMLANSRYSESKLRSWFDALLTIPFGKYKGISLRSIEPSNVKNFLDSLQKNMNNAVYGHDEAKRHIIQMMGQHIRNPSAKGGVLGLYGPPGNGKCFALDTPILMYDGTFKKVQDIIIGDIIMGDDSKPRNVLSLGRGEDNMYEITSGKGDSYVVNSEHILCLRGLGLDRIKRDHDKFSVEYFNRSTLRMTYSFFDNLEDATNHLNYLTSTEDDVIEITVKDYLNLPMFIKNKLRGYKVGVEFNSRTVGCDPYKLGAWLGNPNDIVMNNNLKNVITKYNLTGNDHIPNDYKFNDTKTRLELLAGIIDSSGHYNKTNNRFEVGSLSRQLSDDILYLARSLGFRAYQEYLQNERLHYRVTIYGDNLDEIPLLSINMKYPAQNKQKSLLLSNIRVIPRGRGNYHGFTIDGNNRFLLGNFTVTHNTSLIKEGIAKAMNKPFIFISLGGATDGSFLDGHSYTYEGSIYGRIVNGLITSQCMDPIIYFDELDKISKTTKGEEITNILIHLTDPAQNSHFRDKYFHGVDIDLSRATMIFSFNDPSNVNPILLDRITVIETKYLLPVQKLHITTNYLLPEILKDMGMSNNAIVFNKDTVEYLINRYTNEGGVRKLKGLLYSIVRELNLANLLKVDLASVPVTFPFTVKTEHVKHLLKHKTEIDPEKIHSECKVGVINGLYATSNGVGGVLPIQILWIPTTTPLEVRATGNLQQVIKESTQVASTLAFNKLDKQTQDNLLKDLKEHPKGIHIHCPEGATPKDGPSAGTALTVAIYSVLTNQRIRNDIAITGEITLQGQVTAIGGLENKLDGAKKAGVKLVLYPRENHKQIEKIRERNPDLFNDGFVAQPIETIEEALRYSLVK